MKIFLRLLILVFPVLCMAQSAGIVQQWNGRPAIGVFQITPLPTITWTPTITPTPQNTPSGTSPTWTVTATATSTSTLTPIPTATPQTYLNYSQAITVSFDLLSTGTFVTFGGPVKYYFEQVTYSVAQPFNASSTPVMDNFPSIDNVNYGQTSYNLALLQSGINVNGPLGNSGIPLATKGMKLKLVGVTPTTTAVVTAVIYATQ